MASFINKPKFSSYKSAAFRNTFARSVALCAAHVSLFAALNTACASVGFKKATSAKFSFRLAGLTTVCAAKFSALASTVIDCAFSIGASFNACSNLANSNSLLKSKPAEFLRSLNSSSGLRTNLFGSPLDFS